MLEDKFHAQLHGAGIAHPGHSPESCRRGEGKCQRGEVCMVEDIENFPAQLDRLRFVELNALRQRGIKARRWWAYDDVARLVADPI